MTNNNGFAIAVRALGACDRLEQAVKDGDEEAISQVRAMLKEWTGPKNREYHSVFADMFRIMVQEWCDGPPSEVAMALRVYRHFIEDEIGKTGESDERRSAA